MASGTAKTSNSITKRPKWPTRGTGGIRMHSGANGQWQKKIAGRKLNFGSWRRAGGGVTEAIDAYTRYLAQQRQRDAAPSAPSAPRPACRPAPAKSLSELFRLYLADCRRRVDAGQLCPVSVCSMMGPIRWALRVLPAHQPVLEIPWEAWDAAAQGVRWEAKKFANVLTILRWGVANRRLAAMPILPPSWDKPPASVLRKARQARPRSYTRDELQEIFGVACKREAGLLDRHPWPLWILMGVNLAYGPTDLVELRWRHITSHSRYTTIDFPRPKTGIARRAALWPETANKLQKLRREVVKTDDDACVFPLRSMHPAQRISEGWLELLAHTAVKSNQRGFYGLRHTFRTQADDVLDGRALDLVMGHGRTGISETYIDDRVSDLRLQRVAEHVRRWFFDRDN
jgi:integrase